MGEEHITRYHRHGGERRRSRRGAEQVAISAKIDRDLMAELDSEQAASGIKRNALLNMAARWYLSQLDEARRRAAAGRVEEKYTLALDTAGMTRDEMAKIRHIAAGFGTDEAGAVTELVRQALRLYDSRPFAFMP